MNKKLLKLIVFLVLVNVLWTNFASAQTTTTSGTCSVTLPTFYVNSPEETCKEVGGTWTPAAGAPATPTNPTTTTPTATTTDISSDELKKMMETGKDLVQRRYNGENVTLQIQALKDQCKNIGAQLVQITGTTPRLSYNTIFSDANLDCTWGRYTGTSTTTDNMGRNIVVVPDPAVDSIRINKTQGGNLQNLSSVQEVYKNQIEEQKAAQKDREQAGGISKAVGWDLKAIFDVINSALAWLTAFALMIMAYAVDQTVYATSNGMPLFVQVGWTIVRDIANMFFILILIVIALGTILRIKEYNEYGHLLAKLVVAALLVNFSQVIAVTIINFVNLITAMFVFGGTLKESFSFVYGYIWQDVGTAPNGWTTGLTQGLSMTAFTIVTFVVSLMLAGFFVAKKAGMVGADMMINAGMKTGKFFGKMGLGATDRWLANGSKSQNRFRKALSNLSVGKWARGYEKYQEEEERRAFGVSSGQAADTLYRVLPWQREKTSFGLEAHQSEVLHRAKEKMDLNMSEREMVEESLHAKDPIDKQGWGMAIAALNRQDDFMRILKEKYDTGELEHLNVAKEFTNPLTGKTERLEDILKTGEITPTNFQKVFYGMYLGDLPEKDKLGYASMIQEYAEKQIKPYHLADKIEVETTDSEGKRRVIGLVNYGFAEVRKEAAELEAQAKIRPLLPEEQKKLNYFNGVVGQFTSRMNRTPANRFLNAMRAADIDVQYSDSSSAKIAGFEGESYGDIHDQGVIINQIFGLPHAGQLKNRQHELQSRG